MTSTPTLLACAVVLSVFPLVVHGQAVPPGVPQIITAPAGGTRPAGVSSTLTVTATGNATLTYQWLRGTSTSPTAEPPGATGASFTLATPAAVR